MKRNRQKRIMLSALLLLLAGALLAVAGILAEPSLILDNVTVGDVYIGGMTEEEALARLEESGWQERAGRLLTVHTFGDATVTLDPVEAGVLLDLPGALREAVEYGHGSNPLDNLKLRMNSGKEITDINALCAKLNTAYIENKVLELTEKTDALLGEKGYRIDQERQELVLLKAQGTVRLEERGLSEAILAALREGRAELQYQAITGEAACPDFQEIYDEVFAEMADARYADNGSRELIREKVGYRFSVTGAEKSWAEAGILREVRIPLEVTLPSVTAEKLETLMFHDLLGAVTTKFNNSGENRCSNVRLASEKINGTVLYPGEVFSFNDVVGKRTEEAGFLLAPAYAGFDDIKEEIGGGVCQVSTGVYAAALFARIGIASHTCHIYPPNYIQMGTDATVTIPEGGGREIDLKIENNRIAPIRIVSYCEETQRNGRPYRTVTVEIWGMLEDDEYMPVEFDNSYSNIYDYDRVIEPAYPDREGYKIKLTHEESEFEDDFGKGLRTLTHRKVFDSRGDLIEDRIVNPTYSAGYAMDTYYYMK